MVAETYVSLKRLTGCIAFVLKKYVALMIDRSRTIYSGTRKLLDALPDGSIIDPLRLRFNEQLNS